MSKWKDEDVATPELMKEYLEEFKTNIACNSQFQLNDQEKTRVQESLAAVEKFTSGLLSGKKVMYMHDLILMAIGFYGGYLTALDYKPDKSLPEKKDQRRQPESD